MLPLALVLVSTLTLADPETPAGKHSNEDKVTDMAEKAKEKVAEKIFKSPFKQKPNPLSTKPFALPRKKSPEQRERNEARMKVQISIDQPCSNLKGANTTLLHPAILHRFLRISLCLAGVEPLRCFRAAPAAKGRRKLFPAVRGPAIDLSLHIAACPYDSQMLRTGFHAHVRAGAKMHDAAHLQQEGFESLCLQKHVDPVERGCPQPISCYIFLRRSTRCNARTLTNTNPHSGRRTRSNFTLRKRA